MMKINETNPTCRAQLSLNSNLDSVVDSGGIWLNLSKWNGRIYRNKKYMADPVPHWFTFTEICVNLSVDFYWGKIERNTPALD